MSTEEWEDVTDDSASPHDLEDCANLSSDIATCLGVVDDELPIQPHSVDNVRASLLRELEARVNALYAVPVDRLSRRQLLERRLANKRIALDFARIDAGLDEYARTRYMAESAAVQDLFADLTRLGQRAS